MNFLIFLDPQANELEKILSGTKTMLVKPFDPAHITAQLVKPGDDLYFLRDQDECALQVQATVLRVLTVPNRSDEDPSSILKALQPRLQLTEAQYNHWSTQQQFFLIEFWAAHKIPVIHIDPHKPLERSDWIAFDNFNWIQAAA